LLGFLRGRGLVRPLSPLFDARELSAPHEAQAAHPGGALGLFLDGADDRTPLPGCPRWTLGAATARVRAHARDSRTGSALAAPATAGEWAAIRAGLGERVAGRTSVIVVADDDWEPAERSVGAALDLAAGADAEIVLVDRGLDRAGSARLFADALCRPEVHYALTVAGLSAGGARNLGLALSSGDTVVFLAAGAQPRAGWLAPLRETLVEPGVRGVQSVLLGPDDTVSSAGVWFTGTPPLPRRFLAGHPPEDAQRAVPRPFHALSPGAVLFRVADLVELEGFNPALGDVDAHLDLCLRAGRGRPAAFRVDARSVVAVPAPAAGTGADSAADGRALLAHWPDELPVDDPERWADLGLELRPGPPDVGLVVERTHTSGRALRWGIRLASPGGEKGARWGDTHFAESLADALRARGQEVVTHRRGAHATPATRLDDVALGLRGLDRILPVPGQVNVLWVISHPDDVSPDELEGFDIVFAASERWAVQMSARSGRPVGVLLQATDLTRRADMSTPVGAGTVPVFVGSAHAHRHRRVVADALMAGIDFRVYGPWRGKIDDAYIGGLYVANQDVMSLYRRCGLVLSDHHDDMAAQGFMSNRLFDAVASGARVVSDPVAGFELFEGAVQPYHTPEDLGLLCSAAGRTAFPSDEEMGRIADRVAAGHSFDARAGQLIHAVLGVARAGQTARLSR
jgi:hypothetical protein